MVKELKRVDDFTNVCLNGCFFYLIRRDVTNSLGKIVHLLNIVKYTSSFYFVSLISFLDFDLREYE